MLPTEGGSRVSLQHYIERIKQRNVFRNCNWYGTATITALVDYGSYLETQLIVSSRKPGYETGICSWFADRGVCSEWLLVATWTVTVS